jgi:hypothetical protein
MESNKIFYASQCGLKLNSDVYKGGGVDDTEALQQILDKAASLGRVHLILDGAARISKHLIIHSNTTIECPDKSCGLFLSDGSDTSIFRNANFSAGENEITDRNIILRGGIYNHNSPGQVHHREEEAGFHVISNWVFGMEFYGVENLLVQDITIANQRTFAMLVMNFRFVTMENVHIDRRVRTDSQNQDGLHFWGPGNFLTLRNIYGNSGDDFIALAPDENDGKSSIKDVLIDGVQLDDADQGIRLLSREAGYLDSVVIKNVTGTYRSYSFLINPWFDSSCGGHYGNIVFDTVDVRPLKHNYNCFPPLLFKLGGQIENLTIKNLYHHRPEFSHTLIVAGGSYDSDNRENANQPTVISNLQIEDLYIDEAEQSGAEDAYIRVKSNIKSLSVRNVKFTRSENVKGGAFIRLEDEAAVNDMLLQNIKLPCSLKQIIDDADGTINHINADSVKK